MTSKKLFYVMSAVMLLLVAGLFGGAYEANNFLQKNAKAVVEAKTRSSVISTQQEELIKAKKDVATYQQLGNTARSIVPQDKDQAQTVRQITKLAADNGISIKSVTFPGSTLGGSTGAAASKSAVSNPALSQLAPATGISGVYTLQLIIASDDGKTAAVPFVSFLNFLQGLENNRRTALVSGITITPSATSGGSAITFTLTLDEYVKP